MESKANRLYELGQGLCIAILVVLCSYSKILQEPNDVINTLWIQFFCLHDFANVWSEYNYWVSLFEIIWFDGIWLGIVKEWVNAFVFNHLNWNSKDSAKLSHVVFLINVNQLVHFVDIIPNVPGFFCVKSDNCWFICLKTFNVNKVLRFLLLGKYVLRPFFHADILDSESWLDHISNDGIFNGWKFAYFGKVLNWLAVFKHWVCQMFRFWFCFFPDLLERFFKLPNILSGFTLVLHRHFNLFIWLDFGLVFEATSGLKLIVLWV